MTQIKKSHWLFQRCITVLNFFSHAACSFVRLMPSSKNLNVDALNPHDCKKAWVSIHLDIANKKECVCVFGFFLKTWKRLADVFYLLKHRPGFDPDFASRLFCGFFPMGTVEVKKKKKIGYKFYGVLRHMAWPS